MSLRAETSFELFTCILTLEVVVLFNIAGWSPVQTHTHHEQSLDCGPRAFLAAVTFCGSSQSLLCRDGCWMAGEGLIHGIASSASLLHKQQNKESVIKLIGCFFLFSI